MHRTEKNLKIVALKKTIFMFFTDQRISELEKWTKALQFFWTIYFKPAFLITSKSSYSNM